MARREPYSVIMCIDSLLVGSEESINNHLYDLDVNAAVHFVGGRGKMLQNSTQEAAKYLQRYDADIAFQCTGVNNITRLLFQPFRVVPVYDNVWDFTSGLLDLYMDSFHTLNDYVDRVALMPPTGIHIDKYNWVNDFISQNYLGQYAINEGLPPLQQALVQNNSEYGSVAPWLYNTIHEWDAIQQRHVHKYGKLRDGLHPLPEVKSKWAVLCANAIKTTVGIMLDERNM